MVASVIRTGRRIDTRLSAPSGCVAHSASRSIQSRSQIGWFHDKRGVVAVAKGILLLLSDVVAEGARVERTREPLSPHHGVQDR